LRSAVQAVILRGLDPTPQSSELIPLPQAAKLAYEHLFARTVLSSEDAFDVIASALSRRIAIYGVPDRQPGLVQLSEKELCIGAFRGGAACFECRDNTVIFTNLAVRKPELDELLHNWA
jgi:hypothetical protein